jgi:hypothetical protein
MGADELRRRPRILAPAASQYGAAIRAGLRRRGIEPSVVHEVTDTDGVAPPGLGGLGITVITPMMRMLSAGLPPRVRRMPDR